MWHKLSKEKIVTLNVLKPLGQSNVQIARTLGVSEVDREAVVRIVRP